MSRSMGRHRAPAGGGVRPIARHTCIGLAVFALGVGGSFVVSRLWPDGAGVRAGDTQAGDLLPGAGVANGDGTDEGLPGRDGTPGATTTIKVPAPTSSPGASATTSPGQTPGTGAGSTSGRGSASARPEPTGTRTSTKRTSSPKPDRPATEPGTSEQEASTSATTMDAAALEVVRLVNVERAEAGCGPVGPDAELTKSATGHSRDMAQQHFFSHTSPDGRTFADRIRATGYAGSAIGENIAAGQRSAAEVVEAWMNSDGHRANILNCRFTDLGVGHVLGGDYGHYWTQNFGG